MEKDTGNATQNNKQDRRVYTGNKKRRAWTVRCRGCDTADIGCSVGDCSDLGISKRVAARTVGTDNGKSRRNIVVYSFIKDTTGDAVVEATVLFPIMIMIFAALVLLSFYLPARAALQRATQYAATAIATEISDTWHFFNEGSMTYYRETNIRNLKNVYVDLFTGSADVQTKGETIVREIENRGISSRAGQLTIESSIVNRILYKEAVVTATREFPMPVDLSFIGFPDTISVTATSAAVVQNADEFVRNIDMASDFLEFIKDRFNLHDITNTITSFGSRVAGLLGW